MSEHTIKMNSTLNDLLRVATSERRSKAVARFDFGQGREVVAVVFCNDTQGYLDIIQAYEDSRDRYGTLVANSVAAEIEKNGLPDKDNPRPFNIIASSDGEEG